MTTRASSRVNVTTVDVPRIVFTTASSNKFYLCDIPVHEPTPTAESVGDRFLSGSRVYQYGEGLPAPISAISTWTMVEGVGSLACAAIGCIDGSLHVFGYGASLNSEGLAAGHVHAASPRLVKLRSITPASASDPKQQTPAGDLGLGVHVSASHTGAIRSISPIYMSQQGLSVSGGGGGGESMPASMTASNNVFATSGDDGRTRMWVVTAAAGSDGDGNQAGHADDYAHNLTKGRFSSSMVSLSVRPLADLPSDGIAVTAMSSSPWPWAMTNPTHIGPLLSAAPWLMSSPLLGVGLTSSTAASSGARSLLACGNREGAVSCYEVVVPSHVRNLIDPTAHRHDTGLASLPSIRLVGMVAAARSLDPIMSLAVSPPLTGNEDSYMMAVAAADGTLQLYRLEGTCTAPSQQQQQQRHHEDDPAGPGLFSPPISIVPHGRVGSATPLPSSYDVVSSMGREATLLKALAGDADDDARAGATVAAHLSAGQAGAGRVATALTSAALAGLMRSFVACCFNDTARSTDGDSDASITCGALMACTGGGQVMLWQRGSLPGDDTGQGTAAEPQPEEQTDQDVEGAVSAPVVVRQPASAPGSETVSVPLSPPRAVPASSVAAPSAAASGSPFAYVPTVGDEADGGCVPAARTTDVEPSPQVASVAPLAALPSVLSYTASSKARLEAAAATLRKLKPTTGGRGRSPSPARWYLRTAARDAVRSAYGAGATSSAATEPPSTSREYATACRSRHSKSPVDRAHSRLGLATAASSAPTAAAGGSRPRPSRSRSKSTGRAIPTLAERRAAAAVSGVGAGAVLSSSSTAGRRSRSRDRQSTSAIDVDAGQHHGGHHHHDGSGGDVDHGLDSSWARVKGLSTSAASGDGEPSGATTTSTVMMTNPSSSLDQQQQQNHGRDITAAADPTVAGMALDGTTYGDSDDEEEEGEHGPQPRRRSVGPTQGTGPASSSSPSPPSSLHARLSRRTQGPTLHPSFRSPARIAATLTRDAAIGMRAGALEAKAAAGASDADVDEHPDATAIHARATGTAAAAAGHLVAPSLGSSASIAIEITRLETATFDEGAVVHEILQRRRVTDSRVRGELVARVRLRAADAATTAGEPRLSLAGAAPPHPASVFDFRADALHHDHTHLPDVSPDYHNERERSRSRSKSLTGREQHRRGDRSGERQQAPPHGGSPTRETPVEDGDDAAYEVVKPTREITVTAADMLSWRSNLRGVGAEAAGSRGRALSRGRCYVPPPSLPWTQQGMAAQPPALARDPAVDIRPVHVRQPRQAPISVATINYNPVVRSSTR